MKGQRKDNPEGRIPANGDYGRDKNGDWFGMTPTGHLANLKAHTVIEHPDGSITVSPSILVSNSEGKHLWHGFLEKGEWKQC